MDIYITGLRDFMDLPGAELLSHERAQRMETYEDTSEKARCLAAGLLLRRVLGEDASGQIKKDENGKPFIAGGPYFSVSGAGDIVAVAVSDYGDVGIDVHEIGPYEQELADRHLQDDEQRWLASRPNKEQAFSCLWAGKQSVMKATGLTERLPAASFSILPLSRTWRVLGQSSWYLTWKRVDGHILCVSSMRPERTSIQRVKRDELTT